MAHFVRPLALADSLDTSRYDVYFLCAVAILPLSERQAVGHRGASDYAG
jgi:UDP:flavonoid glycosyltransferase YjiC (YdhE family)